MSESSFGQAAFTSTPSNQQHKVTTVSGPFCYVVSDWRFGILGAMGVGIRTSQVFTLPLLGFMVDEYTIYDD